MTDTPYQSSAEDNTRDLDTKLRQDLGLLEWQIRDLLPIIETHYAARDRTKAQELEKAYGGCHNCYGKGYATEIHAEIAYADFGDELGGADSRKTEGLRLNFCKCSRGRQLEKLMVQAREHTNGKDS